MSEPDGLAKILLEEAERIEAERRAERERLAAMEFQRHLLCMQAVNRAMGELEEYGKLIESSKDVLSGHEVQVNTILVRELQGRLMADPGGVEEDARIYRRLLSEKVEKVQRRIQKRREVERIKRKEAEAMLYFLTYSNKLKKALENVEETYNQWVLKSIANPEFEKTVVNQVRSMGYNVNSLTDIRDTVKEAHRQKLKEELREKLKDNPYLWYASFL